MKKFYNEPEFEVVKMMFSTALLTSSNVPEETLGEDVDGDD